MPCIVGKSIRVSRAALNAIGGLARLCDFLAEDFLLGREVRRVGYRVVLSGDALDTTEVRKSAGAVWARPLGRGPSALGPFAALLALRYAAEGAALAAAGRRLKPLDRALLPVSDLGAAGVFLAGLTGRSVVWRGRPMRDRPGNPHSAPEGGLNERQIVGTAFRPRRAIRSSRFCCVSKGASPGAGRRRR
jgi:hypothetical protein